MKTLHGRLSLGAFAHLAVALAVAAAGCDRTEAGSPDEDRDPQGLESRAVTAGDPPEGGLVKIILQPDDEPGRAAAPIELLLEVEPPTARDAWVESLASEVQSRLATCADGAGEPEVDLVLEVEGGAIAGGDGAGSIADCLVAELAGAGIAGLGDERRRVRLRMGDHLP